MQKLEICGRKFEIYLCVSGNNDAPSPGHFNFTYLIQNKTMTVDEFVF
jgi:hypothetical protein